MKLKSFTFLILSCVMCKVALFAKETSTLSFGTVNVEKCINESKYGQSEQDKVKNIESKMTALISDREKELQTLAENLNNPDFVDSLSPDAEKEMTMKFQALAEECNLYRNQSMQALQQANMHFYEVMAKHIKNASEVVSKQKKLPFIINQNACFTFPSSADITPLIVKAMDKDFNSHNKQDIVAMEESKKLTKKTKKN